MALKVRSTKYNYEKADPHINAATMIAVIWVETFLALAFVALRTIIRRQTKLLPDDYIVYVASVFLVALTAMYTPSIPIIYEIIDVVDGVRAPAANFEHQVKLFLKLQFAMILFFWACIWSVKFSFLAFYKQLFKTTSLKWTIRAWWTLLAICAGTFVGCVVTQFLSCSPLSSYFGIGTCQTPHDLYVSNLSLYYSSGTDIACDLLIMALPLSMLRRLHVDRARKIALAGVFAAGFVIIVFAILRLVKTHPNNTHVNPKWLCILSVTEAAVAVIVSCTPAMRSLFVKATERSRSSVSTKSKKNTDINLELYTRSSSTVPLSSNMAKASRSKTRGTDSPDLDLPLNQPYEQV